MRIIKDFSEFLTESTLAINQDNVDKAMSTFSNDLAGHLGKKEEGDNAGSMVKDFLGRVGLGEGQPWCMAFVYAMFDDLTKAVGIPNPVLKTALVMDHWHRAPAENKIDADPALVKPGMIFIKTRGGLGSGKGHTGIVTGVNGNKFTSIDGNSNDSVRANTYNIGDMVGFIDYFKGIRAPEFESKLDAALSNLAAKAGTAVIPSTGAAKSSGTLIDSALISSLLKKLKEKNFGQDDLKKYSGTSNPSGKGAKFKSSGGGFSPENIKELEEAMDRHGVTNEFARKALIGTCSKESSNAQAEESYFGTSISRIRQVFSKKMSGVSDSEIEEWKKMGQEEFDKRFWDTVYGGKLGNDQAGDGSKYRGRGFNGITFKDNYRNLQQFYEKEGSKLGNINIVNNPELLDQPKYAAEFAVLYFLSSFNTKKINVNDFTSLDDAVRTFVQANAGWGTDLSVSIHPEGLSKAMAFAQSLTTTNSGGTTA